MTDAPPRPKERDAVCPCGAAFRQMSIPAALAVAATARRALASLEHGVPGGWTPTRCPSCERRAIAEESRSAQPDLNPETRP